MARGTALKFNKGGCLTEIILTTMIYDKNVLVTAVYVKVLAERPCKL